MPKIKTTPVRTCDFILASDLVPKAWSSWFWAVISDSAPFSWGDNNRTLVTASRFAEHCRNRLDDHPRYRPFLQRLDEHGETYIDLEN